MAKPTKEEREIAKSYARGEWRSIPGRKSEVNRYQSYVREALQKSRRVNIRISPQDLEGMQARAIEDGIPYQTLMASVIHKYVAGRLVDKRA